MLNQMIPPRALHCNFRLSDATLPLVRPSPELLNCCILCSSNRDINVRAWLSTNSGQPFLSLSLSDLPSGGYSLQLPADQISLYPSCSMIAPIGTIGCTRPSLPGGSRRGPARVKRMTVVWSPTKLTCTSSAATHSSSDDACRMG